MLIINTLKTWKYVKELIITHHDASQINFLEYSFWSTHIHILKHQWKFCLPFFNRIKVLLHREFSLPTFSLNSCNHCLPKVERLHVGSSD